MTHETSDFTHFRVRHPVLDLTALSEDHLVVADGTMFLVRTHEEAAVRGELALAVAEGRVVAEAGAAPSLPTDPAPPPRRAGRRKAQAPCPPEGFQVRSRYQRYCGDRHAIVEGTDGLYHHYSGEDGGDDLYPLPALPTLPAMFASRADAQIMRELGRLQGKDLMIERRRSPVLRADSCGGFTHEGERCMCSVKRSALLLLPRLGADARER